MEIWFKTVTQNIEVESLPRSKRDADQDEYLRQLERDDDEYLYPHDLNIGEPVPSAVNLLREILAVQPDNSVVIVQVGFSTNLAELLQTDRDDYSSL